MHHLDWVRIITSVIVLIASIYFGLKYKDTKWIEWTAIGTGATAALSLAFHLLF
jgi:hypothetical protein